MEQFRRKVQFLTKDHLSFMVKFLCSQNNQETFVKYGLSTEVLRFFFGNKWTNEYVFKQEKRIERYHRKGREFLQTDSDGDEVGFLHRQRVLELAQLAFNLQRVEGFRERIALMERNDLESAYGELDCASLLVDPGLKFRFHATGYEAEVTAPGGRTFCCEIKTKLEETILSKETVASAIRRARKQLPSGKPGLILIKVPVNWIKQEGHAALMQEAAVDCFHSSDRVVLLVFRWDWFERVEGVGWKVAKCFRRYLNERSQLFGEDVRELVEYTGRDKGSEWIAFHQLVEQELRKPPSGLGDVELITFVLSKPVASERELIGWEFEQYGKRLRVVSVEPCLHEAPWRPGEMVKAWAKRILDKGADEHRRDEGGHGGS
jgi:hypothetical protein